MLEIIAVIAAVLAIAIAVVLILALMKPDSFTVRRSAVMQAPAERIFPWINNFQHWTKWSPWENRDPAMKRSFGGSESGKGAIYAWDGNKNVGSGRMEILDASSPSKIVIKLDFFKPFEAHNTAEFTFAPERDASSTNVIWVMQGPSSFMSKVMQVFMNFDTMIGRDFEAGLANLKTLVEHRRSGQQPTTDAEEEVMQLNPYLFYNDNCEAAFKFYEKVLGGKIEMMLRADEGPADMKPGPGREKLIMHARMSIDGQVLMASDSPPEHFHKPQGFSISITIKDPAEAERKFNALAEGGSINMPFGKTFFSKGFGMCFDRFGIPWMVNSPLEGM